MKYMEIVLCETRETLKNVNMFFYNLLLHVFDKGIFKL